MMAKSKAQLFLELAQPDEDGFSHKVSIDKFVGKYSSLVLGNGGSWCRTDGTLGNTYNVIRHKEKGRIVSIELHGFNKHSINKNIRKDISNKIKTEKCVLLNISHVEVDHKDGRRDDPRLNNTETQRLNDFQPLSKAANNAKRQHCKTCRETNKRFDARVLGFPSGWFKGTENYFGTCIGCFWYDPVKFRSQFVLLS